MIKYNIGLHFTVYIVKEVVCGIILDKMKINYGEGLDSQIF